MNKREIEQDLHDYIVSLNEDELRKLVERDIGTPASELKDLDKKALWALLADHHRIVIADGHLACGCYVLGCTCPP